MATTADFSPFKATLDDALEDALRLLLGLPKAVRVTCHVQDVADLDHVGPLVVVVDAPSVAPFELEVAPDDASAAFAVAGGARLTYRQRPGGGSPYEDRRARVVIETVRRRFLRSAAQAWPHLAATVLEWKRFRPVDDWMYRQISWSRRGALATLRLGFRCNQDCSFCWQGRRWPEPPEAFYFRWLEELADAGVRQLTITGGEPTLHRSLPELARRAVARGLEVQVQTNAIRLRDARYVASLREAGVTHLFVSYHASDPAVSDAMTRAPGTHRHTVCGIANALKSGLVVHLNCVVERANYRTLPEHMRDIVARFVRDAGSNQVRLMAFSHPCQAHDEAAWEEALVPLDLLRDPLREAVRIVRGAGLVVDVVGLGCGFPPCLLPDDPEVLRRFDREGFDTMDLEGRTFPATCDACALRRGGCLGIRREYERLYGDRGLMPFERPPPAIATT